jgi:hypothetical protein
MANGSVLNRRTFIATASAFTAGVGVGLVLPTPIMSVSAQAPPPRIYVNARITSVTGDKITGLSEHGPVTLFLKFSSDVWKGRHGERGSVLEPGDVIDVVCHSIDGRLVVQEVFANIVNYYGKIVRVQGSRFVLLPYQPEPLPFLFEVTIEAATEFQNARSGDIRQDMYAQVVGLAEPGNRIIATRVWLYTTRPADKMRR